MKQDQQSNKTIALDILRLLGRLLIWVLFLLLRGFRGLLKFLDEAILKAMSK
ncbi:MAG: hypothetical protein POELPBGB_02959 [Bacteroidia bacterium]|nr:hypothetical protein [Bacteroidia bacterium]